MSDDSRDDNDNENDSRDPDQPGQPDQPARDRWGDPISDDRKKWLQARVDQQREWAAQPEASQGSGSFKWVHLTGADVFWLAKQVRANSRPERVPNLHLEGARLSGTYLEGADLNGADLARADLLMAHLERTSLNGAHLERAVVVEARLERADLSGARLEDAVLHKAHLEGADLSGAHLERANLTSASFDKAARLNEASLNGARLDQVTFDNVNLTVVEWGLVQRLGDEIAARQAKTRLVKIRSYHAAARAYRALAVALRAQGLGSEATRFRYRAELMARREQFHAILDRLFSRRVLTAPAAFGRWFFSWLLGTFAGYGDRLGRLFCTYLVVVSAFAGLMFLVAGRPPEFDSIRDVFVLSITSFHGRGIQPPGLHLNDALATLTAIEAFFGLAIEGIFIAAFTRRVTGN